MTGQPNHIASITVRVATIDDIPFLRAMIWEALLASPTHLKRLGAEKIQQYEDEYWSRWAIQPEPAFIAQDENARPLGIISLRPDDTEQPVRCWRIAIGVERDARGQGVGRRLIEHAFDFAKAEGATYVNLMVDPVNLPAIGLYKKCGFVEIGTRDNVIEMRTQLVAG